MNLVANFIWFILGGELLSVCYIVYGALLCITIIGIPFGIQLIKIGVFAAFPFGKQACQKSNQMGLFSLIFNILYILAGGFVFAILHLGIAILFIITIIGYPFGLQHLKLARLALIPFGKEIKKIQSEKPVVEIKSSPLKLLFFAIILILIGYGIYYLTK